jgi:predicted aspartyl protease
MLKYNIEGHRVKDNVVEAKVSNFLIEIEGDEYITLRESNSVLAEPLIENLQ